MDEAFIMAQVQIRFRPVVQDVHFPVLERAHRAGVYIQVGVEFLKGDLETCLLYTSDSLRSKCHKQKRPPGGGLRRVLP